MLTAQYSDEVLSCFASYRLDDIKVSQRKLEQQQVSEQSYFAKYLTSEKVRFVINFVFHADHFDP